MGNGAGSLNSFSIPTKTFGDDPFRLEPPTVIDDYEYIDYKWVFYYTSDNEYVATTTGYDSHNGLNTSKGHWITITGAGTANIKAYRNLSDYYNVYYPDDSITTTFTVNKKTPTFTFSIANKTYGDTFTLSQPTSDSGGSFTYLVFAGSANINETSVSITSVGSITIRAIQAETANYTSKTIDATFTVDKKTPTFTFSIANKTYGDTFTLSQPTSDSGGSFTYSVVAGGATITGTSVSITSVGSITIRATQAETANYTSKTIDATFTVDKKPPAFTFSIANKTYGDTFTLSQPTSDSGGSFTYSVVAGGATITGTSVSITSVGNGSITIRATQAETTNYASKLIDATFTVNKKPPTFTFSLSNKTYGDTFTLSQPTSDSGGSFTYSVFAGGATITGTSVSITSVGNGSITIRATQAETTNYASKLIDATFTVNKKTSTFSYNQSVVVAKYVLNATASFNFITTNNTDSYTRTFASNNTSVATIPTSSAATAQIIGSGTTTINASQTETTNFTSITQNNILTLVIVGANASYASVNMSSLDLSGTNLSSAVFSNCNMTGVNIFGTTVNSLTNLSTATLLSLKSGQITGITTLLPAGFKMI